MFTRPSFQSKLFATYSLFIIFFTLIISIPMYYYLHNDIEKNISVSTEQVMEGIANTLDLYGSQYENITKQLYLTSDYNGKTPIEYLESLSMNMPEIDRLNAHKAIENYVKLNSEIYPDISRTSIFSTGGEFISNQPADMPVRSILAQDQLDKIRSAKGSPLIQYNERDYWVSNPSNPAFSFIRVLSHSGIEQGFMEMQVPESTILPSNILQSLPTGDIWILNESEILYPFDATQNENLTKEKIAYLHNLIQEPLIHSHAVKNEQGQPEYIVTAKSTKTGLYVIFSTSGKSLFAPLNIFRNVTIGAVLTLIALSVGVFYLLSKVLTSPIRNLRKSIDTVELGDAAINMDNKYQMDEIESLNRSFRKMNVRLQNSLQETIHFKTLQLRTHFEKLQTQINPHFLFNMLGVITRLSEKEGVNSIAVIGRKLADFLRYTINTEQAISNVEREIKFVSDYLELMKSRYLHRLHFEIDIPHELYAVPIPALTLQPYVENCIEHGFHARSQGLSIYITGCAYPDGSWELMIRDNGIGFDPETIERIHNAIETYFERLDQPGHELGIGGMGMVSSFARLKFLYKNQLTFTFGNNPDQGAFVRITGTVSYLEKERVV